MTFEDEMNAALGTFVLEATELLSEMETGLLALEQDVADEESINSVFRAAHTVKGSAGLFGLEHIVRFTHVVESVLDRLRGREIPVSADLIGILLPCKDHIGILIDAVALDPLAAATSPMTAQQAESGSALLAWLEPFLHDQPGDPAAGDQTAGEGPAVPGKMHLSLRFGAESLRNGMDPLSFVRYLSTLGEVVDLTTVADLLPEPEQMDPECCYLAFEVTLSTQATVETVEDVFDFVREDSDIRVLTARSSPADYADLVASFGPQAQGIGEILVRTGAISAADLREGIRGRGLADGQEGGAVPIQRSGDAAGSATGSGLGSPASNAPGDGTGDGGLNSGPEPAAGSAGTATANVEVAASTPLRRAGDRGAGEAQTIRVDAGRLDRLVDAVGELVIAGAGAGLRASLIGDEALQTALDEVMRLVEEVRDGALQLRMVPIGTTFSRFQRIVRDVSAALGKDVELIISGGDTEVDKALVEQISDPLTHLVRNALDHGIELADVRLAAGKPARGTLRLNAFHDSGSIVIEVQDDGGGLDPDRVLAKAIERGLVESTAVLSEKDIHNLIFEPGFSTAAQVSDLSGRGVGMDVVKRNVAALRGTIDVESRPGKGTTLRIRLPLTLAIIDGFLVGVGGATFVIPLDRVVECVELPVRSQRRDCMDLRGEVLPFVRLRSLFSVEGEAQRRENVVVVEYAGTKTGLVVDTLKGEFQTVIKPLGALFGHVQGVGGSTILGNGDVALIIDVPMLVRHVST
jgi:two-component system chemotaxis sensor kinase CheA